MDEIINSIKTNIETTRNEEFKKEGFTFVEPEFVKKEINVNTVDFKHYQSSIRKKALLDKSKPSNINKKEIDTTNVEKVNIVEDEIFTNCEPNNDTSKLDIVALTVEERMKLVNNFMRKKQIKLDEENTLKLSELINNPEFQLKKYVTVSKVFQEITKISFIKKIDELSYGIVLEDTNSSSKKIKAMNFFK